MSVTQAITATAVLDILIGVFLLFNWFAWLAAFVGTIHLVIVFIVSGITDITVRDIGLLAVTLALTFSLFPKSVADKISFWRKPGLIIKSVSR